MKFKKSTFASSLLICIFGLIAILSKASASVSVSAAIGAQITQEFETGKLQISKLVLEEPHIVPADLLNRYLSRFDNKKITIHVLQQVQSWLSNYYYQQGYVNSGVIVPNQKIENGIIKFKAVHGRLTKVEVNGLDSISRDFVNETVAANITVPLNVKNLQKALLIMRRHPRVSKIDGHLSPGDNLGKSILTVNIKEKPAFNLQTQVSNHQSPSIGQYRLDLLARHNNVTGFSDQLEVNIAYSEGLKEGKFFYSLPLKLHSTQLSVHSAYSQFSVLEADVKSESTMWGVSLLQPIINKRNYGITAGIGIDVKHMTVDLFGKPSDLPGFNNGESNSTPLLFNISARIQKPYLAFSSIIELRQGLDYTPYDEKNENQQYSIVTGQIDLAVKIRRKLEWRFKVSSQYSPDTLLPNEKFAIGGVRSVKGYRENLLVRDNGIIANMLFRIPVRSSKINLIPFFDFGRSWNTSDGLQSSNEETIFSTGLGLTYQFRKSIFTEIYWGKTLSDPKTNRDISQDNSVHFLLRYNAF